MHIRAFDCQFRMDEIGALSHIYTHHFPEKLDENDNVWVVEQLLPRGDVRGRVHLQVALEREHGDQRSQAAQQTLSNTLGNSKQHNKH